MHAKSRRNANQEQNRKIQGESYWAEQADTRRDIGQNGQIHGEILSRMDRYMERYWAEWTDTGRELLSRHIHETVTEQLHYTSGNTSKDTEYKTPDTRRALDSIPTWSRPQQLSCGWAQQRWEHQCLRPASVSTHNPRSSHPDGPRSNSVTWRRYDQVNKYRWDIQFYASIEPLQSMTADALIYSS